MKYILNRFDEKIYIPIVDKVFYINRSSQRGKIRRRSLRFNFINSKLRKSKNFNVKIYLN